MPRKLFCYSDEIKYETEDESKFSAYEMQARAEGLKTVYNDYFPYKITDGKIEYLAPNEPKKLSSFDKVELGVKLLSVYKEEIRKEINQKFENSFSEITSKYPATEREGWFFLTAECSDWLNYQNLNSIPALHAECNFTKDYDLISSRAKEILEKSNQYKSFYGQMKANKADRLTELEKATTAKEVLEIEESLNGG